MTKAFDITIEYFWVIVEVIFVIILIVTILAMISVHFNRDIEINNMEAHVASMRFFFSPNCFSYSDGTRTYPGIIDTNKFSETRLDNCMKDYSNLRGFDLILKEKDGSVINEVQLNKNLVQFLPLCSLKKKDFECFSKREYVLIYDNNKIRPGILDINSVIKNV